MLLRKLLFLSVFLIVLAISANVLAVEKATVPIPEDGAVGINEEYAVSLGWTPGDRACCPKVISRW